jgi:HEAT repeat protein
MVSKKQYFRLTFCHENSAIQNLSRLNFPLICLISFVFSGFLFAQTSGDLIQAEEAFNLLVSSTCAGKDTLDEYIETRSYLLSMPQQARKISENILEGNSTWQKKVMAQIILGWLENPVLFGELWDWQPRHSQKRNPYPEMRQETHEKFSEPGKNAVPIMMELLWKKGTRLGDVLASILADLHEDQAIPVIVFYFSGGGTSDERLISGLVKYGGKITPYIIEELNKPSAYTCNNVSLLLALGKIGDKSATSTLRNIIKNEKWDNASKNFAAEALAELKEFSIIRRNIDYVANSETKVLMLKLLKFDRSPENIQILKQYATLYPIPTHRGYNTIRIEAIRSILYKPTEQELEFICTIAPHEPHSYTRSIIYKLLNGPYHECVRKALLEALNDHSVLVRISVIKGLNNYLDQQVTEEIAKALESMLQNDTIIERPQEDFTCIEAAITVLRERHSPLIYKPAMKLLLMNNNPLIQRFAAQALENNPTPKAIEPLMKLLSSDAINVRHSAVRSLSKYSDARILPAITEAIKNEQEPWLREQMVNVLKELEDTQVP